jgi:hypothetical protein
VSFQLGEGRSSASVDRDVLPIDVSPQAFSCGPAFWPTSKVTQHQS